MESTSPTPSSQPVNSSELSSILDTSDIILVGKVLSSQTSNIDPSAVAYTATAELDQVLENQLEVSIVLNGQYAGDDFSIFTLQGILPGRPWAVFEIEEQYLFCLRNQQQILTLTSAQLPAIVVPFLSYRLDSKDPYFSKTANLLEQIILLSGDSVSPQTIMETAILRASLDLPLTETAHLFNSTQSTLNKAAYVLIQLSQGDTIALKQYQGLLNSNEMSQPTREILLAAAIHLQNYNQLQSLPILAELVDQEFRQISLAAIKAIRSTDDSQSEPILIRGLDHHDIEIRYQAVCGLVERNPGNTELPSHNLFLSEENRFLSIWKEWADSKEK